MILEIPRIPDSPNDLRRYHWRYRHRHDKMWKEEVWYAVLQVKLTGIPYAKATVSINRRSRGQLDEDNLYGSMKPVIDALRHAKVLINDTPDHIKLTITQSHGAPLTRIEVRPV